MGFFWIRTLCFTHPGALEAPVSFTTTSSNLPMIFEPPQSSNPPNQKNPQARPRKRLPMTITGSKNQCGLATDVTGIQIWTLAKFRPQASMGDFHLQLPPSTSVISVDMSYTITTSQKKTCNLQSAMRHLCHFLKKTTKKQAQNP